jgi:hypothetical protein
MTAFAPVLAKLVREKTNTRKAAMNFIRAPNDLNGSLLHALKGSQLNFSKGRGFYIRISSKINSLP